MEHALAEKHKIEFENTRTNGYTQRIVRESLETLKHRLNVNWDSGYNLSKTWKILFATREPCCTDWQDDHPLNLAQRKPGRPDTERPEQVMDLLVAID